MTPHLQLLLELGFRKHGAWVATDTGIAYSLDVPFPPYDEALYAFVGGTQVLYVGKRLTRPGTLRTSRRKPIRQ